VIEPSRYVLGPRDYGRWMAPADPSQLPVDLLRPFDADKMTTWKVGKDVGSVKNNTPELCQPV
jgi:putative SOS response-associated peptidase YedK